MPAAAAQCCRLVYQLGHVDGRQEILNLTYGIAKVPEHTNMTMSCPARVSAEALSSTQRPKSQSRSTHHEPRRGNEPLGQAQIRTAVGVMPPIGPNDVKCTVASSTSIAIGNSFDVTVDSA